MKASKWDQRIRRADELAAAHPFAAEGLRFYAALAGFQKSLYEGLEPGNGALGGDLDRSALLPWFPSFLELIQQIAPEPLAQAATALISAGETRWGELLETFWGLHDPTQLNRQGPDVGSQYRSAIFFHSPEQERAATASRDRAQSRFRRPVVTEITPAGPFYPAEDYHQRYLEKRGLATCAI